VEVENCALAILVSCFFQTLPATRNKSKEARCLLLTKLPLVIQRAATLAISTKARSKKVFLTPLLVMLVLSLWKAVSSITYDTGPACDVKGLRK